MIGVQHEMRSSKPERNSNLDSQISNRAAFTLVEMLLATVLVAVLMGGVLAVVSGLARDRRRMEARVEATRSTAAIDLVRRDLANAAAVVRPASADQVLVLVGNAGLHPQTLAPDGRLALVVYVLRQGGRGGGRGPRGAGDAAGLLVREQVYLDDPIRPRRWSEVVSVGVRRASVVPTAAPASSGVRLGDDVAERVHALLGRRGTAADLRADPVPPRARVRIEYADGVSDRDVVLR